MKHQFIIRDAKRLYNSHHADADYIHWGAMDSWTLDEAIALSLGKNPKIINWDFVYEFTLICKEAKEYEQRRDLLASAIPLGSLTDPVSPSLFLRWAMAKHLKVPQPLVTQVDLYLARYKQIHEVAASKNTLISSSESALDLIVKPNDKAGSEADTEANKYGTPPGKKPRVGSGIMTIEAAWQIECATGRKASANDVMNLLQEWADKGEDTGILIASAKKARGVKWMTKKRGERVFKIEACEKVLESWHNSRRQAESRPKLVLQGVI
jgi:hypothetical protein